MLAADMLFKKFNSRVRKTHYAVLKRLLLEENQKFLSMKDDFYKVEDRVLEEHRIRVKRKHQEYEIYGLVPTYEQLKKRKQWDNVDSNTAIDSFLKSRKITYSATDDVDEALDDLVALFEALDEAVDSQEVDVSSLRSHFRQLEDQVVTGAEHLEQAFADKQAADRQRAILMALGLSTVLVVFFFGGGFLLMGFAV